MRIFIGVILSLIAGGLPIILGDWNFWDSWQWWL